MNTLSLCPVETPPNMRAGCSLLAFARTADQRTVADRCREPRNAVERIRRIERDLTRTATALSTAVGGMRVGLDGTGGSGCPATWTATPANLAPQLVSSGRQQVPLSTSLNGAGADLDDAESSGDERLANGDDLVRLDAPQNRHKPERLRVVLEPQRHPGPAARAAVAFPTGCW